MARLIPAFVDDRTPSGERDVFNMFSPGPGDWIVLHALDLAPYNRGIRTEVDFVAVIPDKGGGVRIFVCEAYHDDKESVCQANRRGSVGPQKYLI